MFHKNLSFYVNNNKLNTLCSDENIISAFEAKKLPVSVLKSKRNE
jgi:hypothetical protein